MYRIFIAAFLVLRRKGAKSPHVRKVEAEPLLSLSPLIDNFNMLIRIFDKEFKKRKAMLRWFSSVTANGNFPVIEVTQQFRTDGRSAQGQ